MPDCGDEKFVFVYGLMKKFNGRWIPVKEEEFSEKGISVLEAIVTEHEIDLFAGQNSITRKTYPVIQIYEEDVVQEMSSEVYSDTISRYYDLPA